MEVELLLLLLQLEVLLLLLLVVAMVPIEEDSMVRSSSSTDTMGCCWPRCTAVNNSNSSSSCNIRILKIFRMWVLGVMYSSSSSSRRTKMVFQRR